LSTWCGALVGAVDLVDHHQHLEAVLEGLLEHEARLRHRALVASTSSSTASAMLSVRSTCPPKSAWPGVSTTLMRVPR
jgi:hypothetical protein